MSPRGGHPTRATPTTRPTTGASSTAPSRPTPAPGSRSWPRSGTRPPGRTAARTRRPTPAAPATSATSCTRRRGATRRSGGGCRSTEPTRPDSATPATTAAYEPMLLAAYAAVKAANPAAQVVGGSTSRDLGDPGDPRDAWMWARTLAGDGMPMDAYSVHPYPNWTQPIGERGGRRLDIWDLPLLQSIERVPVMAMEYGWSTAVIDEGRQAQWLSDAIRVAR